MLSFGIPLDLFCVDILVVIQIKICFLYEVYDFLFQGIMFFQHVDCLLHRYVVHVNDDKTVRKMQHRLLCFLQIRQGCGVDKVNEAGCLAQKREHGSNLFVKAIEFLHFEVTDEIGRCLLVPIYVIGKLLESCSFTNSPFPASSENV